MLIALEVTLPKPGKPDDRAVNFRQISLLNNNLQNFASIITTGLSPVLPSLISNDQVGFIKGWQTSDSICFFNNIIVETQRSRIPFFLLTQDTWGMYDTVLHAMLALYSLALVFTLGALSRPFNISNGMHQGLSFVPIIIHLIIGPLAQSIRSSLIIKGLVIGKHEHKIWFFVEDVILVISSPDTSISALSALLQQFSNISYYKVNDSKTLILNMWIPQTITEKIQTYFPLLTDRHWPALLRHHPYLPTI